MRKRLYYSAFLATAIMVAIPCLGRLDCCTGGTSSFGPGEKLIFRVYYNMGFLWITAGNATINVSETEMNGKRTFHILGDGFTAKSYEWFYKVSDRYETYIDEQTMAPVRFLRDVNEGGFTIKNDVKFYQSNGKAVSDTSVFTIPKCTQDLLSAIYFARNIDYSHLNYGDVVPFSLFLDNQVYHLNIKYLGKERITTKMGEYNTIKIVPQVIRGTIFKDEDKLTVWVSDDLNHLPLRVSSPILVGSVKVDLIGYNNLSNPFSSMIRQF